MKSGIHPTWYHNAKVVCSCGNTFETGSTEPNLTVDICNKCHPFFTGELRFVDRQGRVDKFMQRMQVAASKKATQPKAQKAAAKPAGPAKSYQEILRDQQVRLKQAKQTGVAA